MEFVGVLTTVIAVLGLVQGWRLGVRREELQLQRLVLALQALGDDSDAAAETLRNQVRERARRSTARMLELQRQRVRFWFLASSMVLAVLSLVVRALPEFNASVRREATNLTSIVLLGVGLVFLVGVTARDMWERRGSPRFWERSGKR